MRVFISPAELDLKDENVISITTSLARKYNGETGTLQTWEGNGSGSNWIPRFYY